MAPAAVLANQGVAQECDTMADVLDADGRFTTLLAAAGIAGLDGALADPMFGPVTLFAPTDDAFAALETALGEDAWNDLLAKPYLLEQVLLYHLLDGEYYAADVLALTMPTAFETLLGQDIVIEVVENGTTQVWINDVALVIETDLEACNGVIHVIDAVLVPEFPEPAVEVEGANRYLTAVEVSNRAYPDGLDSEGALTVVIATGENWPDALGGTALAGVLDGPVLLTRPATISMAVMAEIDRLGAEKAIILGGPVAVSTAVENVLKAELGDANVDRIDGDTRYETADAIALEVIDLRGTGYDGVAFVATGGNFPDALAAAPLAAAQHWPLFLVNPRTGLSADTLAAMDEVTDALILGGTDVVSAGIATQLDVLLAGDVTRLWGDHRFATAVAIAEFAVAEAGHVWNGVGITTGMDFPDALAGGVLQGKMGSVMLLTRPTTLSSFAQGALEDNAGAIGSITFFGGLNAVSATVRTAALTAAGL